MFKSPSNTGFLPVSQHSSANHLRQAGDAVPRIHSILCLLVTKNLKSNDLMMQTNQIVMRDSTLATISQLTQVHGRPSLQPGIHCVQLELCLQQSKSLVRIAGYRSRWPDMKERVPWNPHASYCVVVAQKIKQHVASCNIIHQLSAEMHIVIVLIQARDVEQWGLTIFLSLHGWMPVNAVAGHVHHTGSMYDSNKTGYSSQVSDLHQPIFPAKLQSSWAWKRRPWIDILLTNIYIYIITKKI